MTKFRNNKLKLKSLYSRTKSVDIRLPSSVTVHFRQEQMLFSLCQCNAEAEEGCSPSKKTHILLMACGRNEKIISRHGIHPSYKSHNALYKYPMMHHFVTEMCTRVHISLRIGTLWDMGQCIVGFVQQVYWPSFPENLDFSRLKVKCNKRFSGG